MFSTATSEISGVSLKVTDFLTVLLATVRSRSAELPVAYVSKSSATQYSKTDEDVGSSAGTHYSTLPSNQVMEQF